MRELTLHEWTTRLHGELVNADPTSVASGWAFDSRNVEPGQIFIAIEGEHIDGNLFIGQAVARGAVVALTNKAVREPHILVNDVPEALAMMASSFRNAYDGPVIGVTGSTGKTSTKEFIAAGLAPLGPIVKTAGNQNTELSVPLVWPEVEGAAAVVVEMAMRGFNQIKHLAHFSKPTIGVVTNIGYSHLEMVGTREGIAIAKAELMEAIGPNGHAVIWGQDEFCEFLADRTEGQVHFFGDSRNSEAVLTNYRMLDWTQSLIEGEVRGERFTAKVPVVGRHLINNLLAALLVASLCGVKVGEAAAVMEQVELPGMRMEVMDRRGVIVILDAYNAAPDSMAGALQVLKEGPADGHRVAILGDMRELGQLTEEAHTDLGQKLAFMKFDQVALIGEYKNSIVAGGRGVNEDIDWICAETIDDLKGFLQELQAGDVVLIKASRSLALERVVRN